jgi:NAD-dependent dihydropyrimidine dehydrogenase PreA subunit
LVRVLLKFSEKLVEKPITAQVILEHGAPITIITAHVDSKGGEILAEIPSTHSEKVINAFRQKDVNVIIPELIDVDSEKCVNCGSCLSLCPMNAIVFSKDFSVVFNKDKCIGVTCGICVDACPMSAIKLVEQNNNENHLSSR